MSCPKGSFFACKVALRIIKAGFCRCVATRLNWMCLHECLVCLCMELAKNMKNLNWALLLYYFVVGFGAKVEPAPIS